MLRLGIDFGTTRTVVAACSSGRYPVVSFDLGGRFRDYIPGIAVYTDGAMHYGWDAAALLTGTGHAPAETAALATVAPTSPNPAPIAPTAPTAPTTPTAPTFSAGRLEAVRSIKRAVANLAPDDQVPGLSAPVTALELTTGFLRYVQRMLRQCSNLAPDPLAPATDLEAVVAVPAHASTRQRYLTLEAFTRAGFDVIGMRNEPTAAAIEFAQRHRTMMSSRSPKRYVVVYDLGGGTFDTSAVSLAGRRFEVLATAGIGALGGDDFDEAVVEMVLAALAQRGADIDELTVGSAAATAGAHAVWLRELCREAKETLSPHSRKLMIDVSALWPGVAPVIIPVSALYQRCQGLIERTLACVREVFANLPEHGLDPDDSRTLGGLYLVGGAAAFPPVARQLRAVYGRKIQLAPQPYAATAVGLALCADADPRAALLVREAVTRHFGVWREAEDGREKVFDPILAKNQVITSADGELVVQRTYRPTHTVGRLRFLECSGLSAQGQPSGDLKPVTQICFPYDPALAHAGDCSALPVERRTAPLDEEIAETYIYSPDGTIAVEIENRTRGYRRSFVLDA